MVLYSDYESLYERYSIMTVDGKEPAELALQYCIDHTTLELAERLKTTVKPAQTRENVPTLLKYIDAGFYFYPCDDESKPICCIYSDDKNTMPERRNRIESADRLYDFLNGKGELCKKGTGEVWTNTRRISRFCIYPDQFNLFCIDIDSPHKATGGKHGTGTNGIEEFLHIIAKVDMTESQRKMFVDFPANFPCYVLTPSGGIHLYFKLPRLPEKWQVEGNVKDNDTATNVECKYHKQITIAGSTKAEKQYELHGDLCNIPSIPLDLLNICCKPRPKPQSRPKVNQIHDGNKNRWEITPLFCMDRGKSKAGLSGNHDMFLKIIGVFKYFYEKTGNEELNASNCRFHIMQDHDFQMWSDHDKESQINQAIKDIYGEYVQ